MSYFNKIELTPIIQSIIACELGANPVPSVADSFIAKSTPRSWSWSSTFLIERGNLTYSITASWM